MNNLENPLKSEKVDYDSVLDGIYNRYLQFKTKPGVISEDQMFTDLETPEMVKNALEEAGLNTVGLEINVTGYRTDENGNTISQEEWEDMVYKREEHDSSKYWHHVKISKDGDIVCERDYQS